MPSNDTITKKSLNLPLATAKDKNEKKDEYIGTIHPRSLTLKQLKELIVQI